jgi:hypothetical protein
VRGPATRVEIWLDATRVAELDHAPWQTSVALGTEIRPHRLEARALDAEGSVVARAMQVLNLPRPVAEAQILLERDATNHVIGARLAWQNLTNAAPTAITLELDGKPRALDTSGNVTLTGLAPDTIHVLTAELRFPNGAAARSDVAFGGELGELVGGELTGVPLAGKAIRGADLASLGGALLAGGTARTPAAIENGAGALVVVRASTAAARLCRVRTMPRSASRIRAPRPAHRRRARRRHAILPSPCASKRATACASSSPGWRARAPAACPSRSSRARPSSPIRTSGSSACSASRARA